MKLPLALAAAFTITSASHAQTVPLTFEASGTVSQVNASIWDANPGDPWSVLLELQLDTSAPFSSEPGVSVWSSTGTMLLTVGNEPPQARTGACPIQLSDNPFGQNRRVISLNFNDGIPITTGRFLQWTLASEPGQNLLDPSNPPTSADINALSLAYATFNPNSFRVLEQSLTLNSVSGYMTAFEATGGALPPAPEITGQPVGDIVNPGETATFAVVASGVELAFQWRRDGVPLSDGPKITGSDTASLQITASANDDALYDVVVTNPGGSTTSLPAILAVRNTCPADQNFDGIATPADFNAWILNYNTGCP